MDAHAAAHDDRRSTVAAPPSICQIRGPRLAALGLGLAVLLAAPAIWAVSAIVAPGAVMLPSASADRLDGRANDEMRRRQVLARRYAPDDPALAAFLTAHRGNALKLYAIRA